MKNYEIKNGCVIGSGETLPVIWEGDVIVAGGGCGGIGAAIASKRHGAKTIIVEGNGYLGGMASYGMGMPLGGAYPGLKTIGGIAEEILTMVRNAGKDAADVRHVHLFGDWYYHDSDFFRSLSAECVIKEQVEVLLHSFVSDVLMKDDETAEGIVIESKSGRQVLKADVFIDATGDADLCARAGAAYEKGDESGAFMAVTIPFNYGGCDTDAFLAYLQEDPTLDMAKEKARSMGLTISDEDRLASVAKGLRPGWIFDNSIRVRNVDGTDVWQLTKAELEARIRIRQHLDFYRAVIPGCENAYLANTAPTLGIRDTRRIVGEDYLSTEDCLSLRKRPESVILRCAGPFDNLSRGSKNNKHNEIDITQYYDIPYGCIVPQRIKNIVVAGRTFSSSALAQSGSRGQALLMGMGHAAGVAAAMAVCNDLPFRDIPIKKLQEQLILDGCNLGIS